MPNEFQPRFSVGTTFKTAGKHSRLCTVTDFHVTRNLAGEVVKSRYVATHQLFGQTLTEYDIPETTISRGISPEHDMRAFANRPVKMEPRVSGGFPNHNYSSQKYEQAKFRV